MKNTIWAIAIIAVIVVLAGGIFLLLQGPSTGMATSGSQPTSPSTQNYNTPSTTTAPASPPSNTPQQSPESQGKTYHVAIQNFAFSPSTLNIKKGDTVIWTNMDSAPHTVTSDTGKELSSAKLSKGQTFSYTFDEEGTYAYHCAVHPMMKGTIVVGTSSNSGSSSSSNTAATNTGNSMGGISGNYGY